MSDSTYKKISRFGWYRDSGSFLFQTTRGAVFLADDHLLIVNREGFRESYNTINYKDIQALSIRRNPSKNRIRITLISLTFILGAIAASIGGEVGFAIWAVLFLPFILANEFFGITTTCYLKTAVKDRELPGLRRLKKARKVLHLIQERVNDTQEAISPSLPQPKAEETEAAFSEKPATEETDSETGKEPSHP